MVIIEQGELDYISKLGAHYHEHPMDLRNVSSKSLVDEAFGNKFEQNTVKGKLGMKQANPRLSSPDKQDEVEHFKRKQPLKC